MVACPSFYNVHIRNSSSISISSSRSSSSSSNNNSNIYININVIVVIVVVGVVVLVIFIFTSIFIISLLLLNDACIDPCVHVLLELACETVDGHAVTALTLAWSLRAEVSRSEQN